MHRQVGFLQGRRQNAVLQEPELMCNVAALGPPPCFQIHLLFGEQSLKLALQAMSGSKGKRKGPCYTGAQA